MVLAVAKAAEAGAAGHRVRLDRQHVGVGGGLRRGGRDRGHRRPAEGPDRGRQAAPGARGRRPGRRHRRQLRPGAQHRPGARRTGRPPGDAGQLGQPVPPRGPEDRGLRDLRRPRTRAGRAGHPGRQRRQHQRLLGRVSAITRRPALIGIDARGCGASRRPVPRRSSSATGSSTRRRSRPRSGSAIPPRGPRRSRRATRSGGRISAVTDDEILAAYRALARYEGIFCEPASAASVAGRHQGGRPRASSTPTRPSCAS